MLADFFLTKETLYVTITGSFATLPCEIQKSKITAELILIPSKLLGLLES